VCVEVADDTLQGLQGKECGGCLEFFNHPLWRTKP
jgi:hypothetical protein